MSMLAGDVDGLRSGGQASVDALHKQLNGAPDELLDGVCAQKDCHASRLFWYTDLEEAKKAAQAAGKPIVSLHLLGRLDEEVSCANSRFFRVLLYSDPEISKILRERYVLHWHSVRPVPRVTIDMGDGRKIRQTITGNSIHYLLDSNGQVLDGLPGLQSPKAFRAQLEEWLTLNAENVQAYHHERRGASPVQYVLRPRAEDAASIAVSKAIVERPLLQMLTLGTRLPRIEAPEADDVVFSAESLALMRTKQPVSEQLLDGLRRTVALDTRVNAELHGLIHTWLANEEVTDLESLNERVYAELFLTPNDDPWLGLKPASVFTALSN
jgi:hypothetical protein